MARQKSKNPGRAAESIVRMAARFNEINIRLSDLKQSVIRLQYENPSLKNQHLGSIDEISHTFEILINRPEVYLDLIPGAHIDAILDIENYSRRIRLPSTLSMRGSGDLKYAPSTKIQEIAPDLTSMMSVYLALSAERAANLTPRPNVPRQRPAPVRVVLNEKGQIRLDATQTHRGSLAEPSIENLRSASRDLLQRTIDQLGGSSNADPRLSPNLRGLLTYLSRDMDGMPIEALGLNFQFARMSFDATRDTVPDIIAGQIDQILTTVNVILNQYEEWRLFLDAAAATQIAQEDVRQVIKTVENFVIDLEDNADVVEKSVVERFREITDAYSQGLINVDAVAVPLLESMANVFSILSSLVVDSLPHAASVGATQPGAILLTLGFAVAAINKFTPTVSKFPPLSYLLDVHRFAMKNFSQLKDSIGGKP